MGDTSWSLGVLIGLPFAALAILVGIGMIVLGFALYREGGAYGEDWMLMLGGAATVVSILVGTLYFMWPLDTEYHQWQPRAGTVEAVDKRILSSGDGIEEKFVVRLDDGQEYGCQDTRCALVKAGDDLSLSCKRAWQYTGRDGWDCRYADHTAR